MLNVQEKVSIVNELRQEWPLSRLLIVSGLPRSTFYYHVRRLAAPDRYQSARALVLKIYHQHKGRCKPQQMPHPLVGVELRAEHPADGLIIKDHFGFKMIF